jgi:hypothetical protein
LININVHAIGAPVPNRPPQGDPHWLHVAADVCAQATIPKLGVGLDIIDRCQNHALAGSKVRPHYMHHEYADEKRAAWAALRERSTFLLEWLFV